MKRYLLDSTPLAAYLTGRRGAVALTAPWVERREAATSILVYGEIVEYLKGRPEFPQRKDALRRLLAHVYPFTLTLGILEQYADIRRQLRPPHGPGLIGDVDILIAATAIERGLTLVTADGDFLRIPDLRLILVQREELR